MPLSVQCPGCGRHIGVTPQEIEDGLILECAGCDTRFRAYEPDAPSGPGRGPAKSLSSAVRWAAAAVVGAVAIVVAAATFAIPFLARERRPNTVQDSVDRGPDRQAANEPRETPDDRRGRQGTNQPKRTGGLAGQREVIKVADWVRLFDEDPSAPTPVHIGELLDQLDANAAEYGEKWARRKVRLNGIVKEVTTEDDFPCVVLWRGEYPEHAGYSIAHCYFRSTAEVRGIVAGQTVAVDGLLARVRRYYPEFICRRISRQ